MLLQAFRELYKVYTSTTEKCDSEFISFNSEIKLELGTVFAMYNKSIVYGLIYQDVGYYKCLNLVDIPILGQLSLEIEISAPFAPKLFTTPLSFNLLYEDAKYCQVLGKLDTETFASVLAHFEKVRFEPVYGIKKQFLDFEASRLQVLHERFLATLLEEMDQIEDEDGLIPWWRVREIVEALLRNIPEEELAVAATKHERIGKFILTDKEDGTHIYFPDELVGKRVRLKLSGEVIFDGNLPAEIILGKIGSIPLKTLAKYIELEELDNSQD